MHVKQDEFRSVNELLKQIAYTFVCYLIYLFFATNSERIEQLRRKVLIITAQMKRALHPHFRQKTQKISQPWKKLHDCNS